MSTPLPMTAADPRALWYKDAVIDQLHVRTFADSHGDVHPATGPWATFESSATRIFPDRMLLAEANRPPELVRSYFGDVTSSA